ncbi:Cathepsin L [Giardia muris]|uniref:Cathepsin L n=1 Tax=Giardia muris TaxID=5742 RepID=A0A4Z1SRQ3_GIAMU|nr:Cathepsin L [Giardia muris]|eukprot:TNJ28604.1 Cathepsin L [Giardia muris]
MLPCLVLVTALADVPRLFQLYLDRYNIELAEHERGDVYDFFARRLAHLGVEHAETLEELDSLVQYSDGNATYGLTSRFGVPMVPNLHLELPDEELRASGACPLYYRVDTNGILVNLPSSVDLRELGLLGPVANQGQCGSCWAHGTAASIDSLVRRTRQNFKDDSNVDQVFKQPNFVSSVQYIMNNTSPPNKFCDGGNFLRVAQAYVDETLDTVETEQDFPLLNLTGNPTTIVKATRKVTQPFHPYKTIGTASDGCNISFFSLFDLQNGQKISKTQINTLKSWLARGIAVPTTMNTMGDGLLGAYALSDYRSGVFHRPCNNASADHQVAFAGYGKYRGQDVWLVRNSWGEYWGIRGFFMVPIGANTLCIETRAYVGSPAYFTSRDMSEPYARQPDADKYWSSYVVRDTETGLDVDNGSLLPVSAIVVICIIVIIVVGAVVAAIVFLVKKRSRQSKDVRRKFWA